MRSLTFMLAAFGALLLCITSNAAVIIDFDGATQGGIDPPGYDEDGYTLNPGAGSVAGITDQDNVAGLSSSSNQVFFVFGSSFATLTDSTNDAFNLISLDLGYLDTGFPSGTPVNVTVLGNLSGGGTVSHVFSGVGTGLTFESLAGFGFTNLASVVFSADATNVFALDNIQVDSFVAPAAVPEPASAAALCLGSLALVVRRLRRRSSVVA